ncbi:Cysteine protease atg4 [Quaeritorhiza haematococci]|nr:Cysteine protease atg4 [Quaeritorhiza haematococci]
MSMRNYQSFFEQSKNLVSKSIAQLYNVARQNFRNPHTAGTTIENTHEFISAKTDVPTSSTATDTSHSLPPFPASSSASPAENNSHGHSSSSSSKPGNSSRMGGGREATSVGGGEGEVTLLGVRYRSLEDRAFQDDFFSRLWLTYRTGYPPIKPSTYTTDVGWGCMLRSGQMMLASGFIFHYLNRGWRLSHNGREQATWDVYIKIVTWFLDSNTSPYSIHRIALLGKQFEKDIGQWFGPSTISQVLKVLIQHHKETDLTMYVATDGVVYKDELRTASTQSSKAEGDDDANSWKPLLILVPLRLGLENLNPVYHPALKVRDREEGKRNWLLYFCPVKRLTCLYADLYRCVWICRIAWE